MLATVHLYEKYGSNSVYSLSEKSRHKVENAMLDAEHVAFACLCGGLASVDAAMIRDFRAFKGDGFVIDASWSIPEPSGSRLTEGSLWR